MWLASSVLWFTCNLLRLAGSSTCPEPKKPHLTSCTIFYSCVNLPGGGYVWVPSKCNKGLVFQPYLRICVVPGDIWTCDTLAADEEADIGTTRKYDATGELSDTIDSSYVIDDFSDPTTEAVTAIPLIEFEERPEETTTRGYEDGAENAPHRNEENYLHGYANGQLQTALSLVRKYQNVVDIHRKWLNELTSRLRVYKEMSAAITASLAIPSVRNITIINPTQTVTIFASHNHKQNLSLNYPQSVTSPIIKPETEDKIETSGDVAITSNAVSDSALKLLIDSLDADNNIIRVDDDLGTRRYLTIDDYRRTSYRLKPRHVSVVMCTRSLRLANKTDCGRYYTCDPETASLIEYPCPPRTAFNANLRVCDVESAKTCGVADRRVEHSTSNEMATTASLERETTTTKMHDEEKPRTMCRELGKMKDPSSDSRYYICYSAPGSEGIKSIRMTCPNSLIFCQSKKVCTTKRLCATRSR